MSLPLGTWKINVNGTEADFVIQQVGQLEFVGFLFGNFISGFWDEVSQTITFSLLRDREFANQPPPVEPSVGAIALFKGYLFRSPLNPEPGRDVLVTLAGFVQVNHSIVPAFPALTGANSRRNVFGWMAQISEVV